MADQKPVPNLQHFMDFIRDNSPICFPSTKILADKARYKKSVFRLTIIRAWPCGGGVDGTLYTAGPALAQPVTSDTRIANMESLRMRESVEYAYNRELPNLASMNFEINICWPPLRERCVDHTPSAQQPIATKFNLHKPRFVL